MVPRNNKSCVRRLERRISRSTGSECFIVDNVGTDKFQDISHLACCLWRGAHRRHRILGWTRSRRPQRSSAAPPGKAPEMTVFPRWSPWNGPAPPPLRPGALLLLRSPYPLPQRSPLCTSAPWHCRPRRCQAWCRREVQGAASHRAAAAAAVRGREQMSNGDRKRWMKDEK